MIYKPVDLTRKDGALVAVITIVTPNIGWEFEASAVQYVTEPEDGIQDVVVSGTRSPVVLPAFQTHVLEVPLPDADWVQGVRVKGSHVEKPVVLRSAVKGRDPVGTDMVMFSDAGLLTEDTLTLDVRYGGGCKAHSFQLNWDGTVGESMPETVTFRLSHNDNGDPCKALVNERLQFDLSGLLPSSPSTYRILVRSDAIDILANDPAAPSAVPA